MKRLTVFVIFLLLAGALALAGDAWRKVNNYTDRSDDVDDTVRPLRHQMSELRSEIKDLHKLYMKQLATLEKIDAELNSRAPASPETVGTKLLTTPVVKKETTIAKKKTTIAQKDSSAEKLLSEFVESMEREPVNAKASQLKTSPKNSRKAKQPSIVKVRTVPVRKTDGPRKKLVFETQTDGTLKKTKASAAVKIPKTTKASSNLPVFLDIDSMVSTTATAVVTADRKEKTVKKTTATVALPRRSRNTVKEAAPELPGATPATVAAMRADTRRTRITAVTPGDLSPTPGKREKTKVTAAAKVKLPKVLPVKVAEKKPVTEMDALFIDLQKEQRIVESESRIVAGINKKETIPEASNTTDPDTISVAPKRVTSVPAVTAETKVEVVDLRPSQLYKQRKRAADIMRVTMTDQLSSGTRRKVKRTMADILDEYDAGSE